MTLARARRRPVVRPSESQRRNLEQTFCSNHLGDHAATYWALSSQGSLLDHLVGAGEEPGRDCKGQLIRGPQIDYQLKAGRLLHREFAGQSTFHYTTYMSRQASPKLAITRPVAEQAALVRHFTPLANSRQSRSPREFRQRTRVAVELRVGGYHQRACTESLHARERARVIGSAFSLGQQQINPGLRRNIPHLATARLCTRCFRVDKGCDAPGTRD